MRAEQEREILVLGAFVQPEQKKMILGFLWYICDRNKKVTFGYLCICVSRTRVDRSKVVLLLWIFYAFSVLCLLCICANPFICALLSPARKGFTS